MAERLLRKGSRGEDVREVQLALRLHGFDPIQIDGIFGPNTDAAVRAFQAARGLDVDGIVGPLTRAALAESPAPPPPPPPSPPSPPPTTTFVRRDVWTLESAANPFDPVTLAYARAVAVMQARPASDPTSWTFQAAIHGTQQTAPPGVSWNECQHRSWFFLPWHRMYLFFFERIVRAAVVASGGPADFALPYWNYDQPAPATTLPPAFRAATLPDGSANPLLVGAPRRDPQMSAGGALQRPEQTSSARAMALRVFSSASAPSFGGGPDGPSQFAGSTGALEAMPHNPVHPAIGGTASGPPCQQALMTSPFCAALDPIFWLHHANIDRLWNRWLALGDGRSNPGEAAWLTQRFAFHDETGAQVTLSVADVLDTGGQLRYVYEDLTTFVVPQVSVPPQPPRPPELVAATEEPLELTGSTTSISLTVPSSAEPLAASTLTGPVRVIVNVDDIEAERDPGISYAAYLNLPEEADEATRERHWIGTIGFFGIEAMNDPGRPHDGAPGLRHSFDVSDIVETLKEQGEWDPISVVVSFKPLRPLPPPGEEAIEAEEAETVPVRIGRVGLFVG